MTKELRASTIIIFYVMATSIYAQNTPPVAVNDTIHVFKFDDTLYINLLVNDYDPDGDSIFVVSASQPQVNGVMQLAFPYHVYYKQSGIILRAAYYLSDGVDITQAMVYAHIHNPFYDFLDINQVSARINNKGNHFWDLQATPHYLVPKTGLASSLFSTSLWVGGLDSALQLHLAGNRYGGNGQDYWSGPVTGAGYMDNIFDSTWNRVWKINRAEIEYHKEHWWASGYMAPEPIVNWPGNENPNLGQAGLLAPFYDYNGNGIYEPYAGDYPLIRGDQSVFFIMNDVRRTHTETGGEPLGLEVHGWAYAFDCDIDSALKYTTFLHYDLYNRSTNTYVDTYFGIFTDADVGNWNDDFIACDVVRGSMLAFNGLTVDGSGDPAHYGAYPPGISVTVLAGPYLDPDNTDNPKEDAWGNPLCDLSINGASFEDGVVDNERYGMNRFYYFNNIGSIVATTDPTTAGDYYSYLLGYWKDGQPMQYGGGGHPSTGATGPACHFMFPGLTDPCNWGTNGIQPPGYITGAGGSGISWTEVNMGNEPYDRRGLISMGPLTFKAGDKQELDLAFVWARQYTDTAVGAVLPLLGTRIDDIRSYFLTDATPCGGSFSGLTENVQTEALLKIYPNPASIEITIQYPVATSQADYHIIDMLGNEVDNNRLSKGDHHRVPVHKLKPGVYVIVLRDNQQIRTARLIKSW